MSVKLPTPPAEYSAAYEAQRNRLLEQAIAQLFNRQQDVVIAPPVRLIMSDEDGHQVEIYVSHSEQVRARHI